MKATGIIRRVDELGRIVIPKEIRKIFGIESKDPIEIFVDGNKIALKKVEVCCEFCRNENNIQEFKGTCICSKCIKEISNYKQG